MNQHNSFQNNNRNPVIISASDHNVIRKLIGNGTATSDEMTLAYELNRAIVVSKEEVPAGTVGLGSTVSVLDLDTNKKKTFTIVIPSRADIKSGLVSILSPIGAALIGFRKGQDVVWHMPRGLKQFRITEVHHNLQKTTGE
jgi:regulator of nucleoside diphosphate kinase